VYWRCTDGAGAFLQVPGLIDDQDRVLAAEVIADIVTQVVTHRVGIPCCPGEEVLQSIRCRVIDMLGNGPAVLPWQLRYQAEQQFLRPTTRLDPTETARDPPNQLIGHRPPQGRAYAGARGRQAILGSPHNRP
jgi:hypothetical protein